MVRAREVVVVMLNFTLAPEGCGRLFDALTCLAKFSEWVTIEALPTQVDFLQAKNLWSEFLIMAIRIVDFDCFEFVQISLREIRIGETGFLLRV